MCKKGHIDPNKSQKGDLVFIENTLLSNSVNCIKEFKFSALWK